MVILLEGGTAPPAPSAAAGMMQGAATVAKADPRKARRVDPFMTCFSAFMVSLNGGAGKVKPPTAATP